MATEVPRDDSQLGDGSLHFTSFRCLVFACRCANFNANLANAIWRTMCLIHGDERKDRGKRRTLTYRKLNLQDLASEEEGVLLSETNLENESIVGVRGAGTYHPELKASTYHIENRSISLRLSSRAKTRRTTETFSAAAPFPMYVYFFFSSEVLMLLITSVPSRKRRNPFPLLSPSMLKLGRAPVPYGHPETPSDRRRPRAHAGPSEEPALLAHHHHHHHPPSSLAKDRLPTTRENADVPQWMQKKTMMTTTVIISRRAA